MNKNTFQGQILISFANSSCLPPDDSAGRIAVGLLWTSFPVDIIPPWLSMLVT
jgi:hypothetical protein